MIAQRIDNLIQSGERRILQFTFNQLVTLETLHVRLTALSWGCVIDPQPTVIDRLIDIRAWKTTNEDGLVLFDGHHYTFPAASPCDTVGVFIDAKPSFAIARAPYQAFHPIDAVEIVATLIARPFVDDSAQIKPYQNGVEAPLG